MVDNTVQCCYTNTSQQIDGKIRTGWQTVAVSDEIPPVAYRECTKIQGNHSEIKKAMTDEDGAILNLLEFIGDGTYLYVMRTKYGLSDHAGRANMFSHAYIFPWTEEGFLRNPNAFLTIADGNFAQNEDAAQGRVADFTYTAPFNLEFAMQKCGMSTQTYCTLIQCVYAQMSDKKIADPLFVQYDGTVDQLRAALYCIYYALPYHLRKFLSASSAATSNTQARNIIFSKFAESQKYYVVPSTGENSILTPRIINKIERYGYVDYIAKKYRSIQATTFFDELQDFANILGNGSGKDEVLLSIAYQLQQNADFSTYSDQVLQMVLSDIVRTTNYGSIAMERYTTAMLAELNRRGLFLTDASESNLLQRLESAQTEEFQKEGDRYTVACFASQPLSEAIKKLSQMHPDAFLFYASRFAKTERGTELLDTYYENQCVYTDALAWEQLAQICRDSSSISARPKTRIALVKCALQLYQEKLAKTQKVHDTYVPYVALMQELLKQDDYETCCAHAKELYWKHITFVNFSLEFCEEYQLVSYDTTRVIMFFRFAEILLRVGKATDDDLFLKVNRFFKEFKQELGTQSDEAIKIIGENMAKESNQAYDQYLHDWLKVVSLLSEDAQVAQCVQMRQILHEQSFTKLALFSFNFFSDFAQSPCNSRVTPMLIHILLETIIACDAKDDPITVDMWLLVGNVLYENAFTIFDEYEPYILDWKPAAVVRMSVLLGKPEFIHAAKKYILTKGNKTKVVICGQGEKLMHTGVEAKRIKKWIQELAKKPKMFSSHNAE